MSIDKALQYTQKIQDALQKLPSRPHEIELDSILGYVRILYSTLKDIHTVKNDPQEIELSKLVVETNPATIEMKKSVDTEKTVNREQSVFDTNQALQANEAIELSSQELRRKIMNETEEVTAEEPSVPKTPQLNPSETDPLENPIPAIQDSEPTPVIPVISGSETTNVEETVMPFDLEVNTTPVIEDLTIKNSPIAIPSQENVIYSSPATMGNSDAIAELFREKSPTGLVDFLGLSPLDDLRKAWGLNEKMLLIKDLFGNDGAAFEETISILNKLTSFDEARQYLSTSVIPKFEWYDISKNKKAGDFITQVKRLFVKS